MPRGVAMRELIADLFTSLDGFASGVNEAAFFGYFGEGLAAWVREHLDRPQVLLMGRVTFLALAQFSSTGTDETSVRTTELPKLVFSRTLAEPLVWKNSRLARTSVENELRALKSQPGDPLRSIGSITLVQSMIKLGLVDRLRLMVFPVILGTDGREPIYAGYSRTPLELIDTRVLDSRLTLLEYKPVRSAQLQTD
jgi:dihydrofolate reductase